jgi:hypothetical protein
MTTMTTMTTMTRTRKTPPSRPSDETAERVIASARPPVDPDAVPPARRGRPPGRRKASFDEEGLKEALAAGHEALLGIAAVLMRRKPEPDTVKQVAKGCGLSLAQAIKASSEDEEITPKLAWYIYGAVGLSAVAAVMLAPQVNRPAPAETPVKPVPLEPDVPDDWGGR